MFNLTNSFEITLDEIFKKVNELDLWKYYCKNFEEIDKSFCSELYDDRNPGCRIFYSNNNKLLYKDFGDEGKMYGVFDYIQIKYNCTFKEALRIVANDFNILKSNVILNTDNKELKLEEKFLFKPKSTIRILPQPFNYIDYKYWEQYGIPLKLLEEYNVYACKEVYLYKKDRIITFTYHKSNPIYAYKFITDGKVSYKIYFPLADKKHKWLFSGGSADDIEGYDQLNHFGDKLILTKSLKDCMVYRLCGYNAISLQGETNKLSSELVNKLYKRYDKIIVNYDNDAEGIRGSLRLKEQYNFDYFFIDEFKDISDYCKNYGLEKTKEMIKIKLNE
jgi:hypothetical protein